MRALCGSIITAGALIGLGLTALGIGNRYQYWSELTAQGETHYLTFKGMDTPLTLILVILILAVLIGLGIAFIGLAFHHHRRHLEILREHHRPGDTGQRVHVQA